MSRTLENTKQAKLKKSGGKIGLKGEISLIIKVRWVIIRLIKIRLETIRLQKRKIFEKFEKCLSPRRQ